MRAYDLFEEFKGLTQKQRDDAIGYFLGGVGMDFEGFTDSKERRGFDRARYSLDRFQAALWYAQGVRIDIQIEEPGEVVQVEEPAVQEQEPKPGVDWVPVLMLAFVVWIAAVLIRGY